MRRHETIRRAIYKPAKNEKKINHRHKNVKNKEQKIVQIVIICKLHVFRSHSMSFYNLFCFHCNLDFYVKYQSVVTVYIVLSVCLLLSFLWTLSLK